MLGHPLLSRQEEAELSRGIRRGEEAAVHELIRHNARLAWVMAEQWAARSREQGAETEDLFSVAIVALYKAAKKFRPRKGSFATYAEYFVRDALRAEVGNTAVVRRRLSSASDRRRAAAASWEWLERTGVDATGPELAATLGWTERKVTRALPRSRALSLDATGGEGSTPLGEQICDGAIAGPDEQCLAKDRTDQLRSALGQLDKRSREVISRRFGLGKNGKRESLRAVGQALGLSGERARQIERVALGRLRAALMERERHGSGGIACGRPTPLADESDFSRPGDFTQADVEEAFRLTA